MRLCLLEHLPQAAADARIRVFGSGKAISKAISCGEIIKRKIAGIHQISEVFYTTDVEVWEPKLPEEKNLDM
eukprot:m.77177 g.77177  ORF g.77177 m.77177 type:complete len:72 (+) comp17271_c1_seq2:28-243(+)